MAINVTSEIGQLRRVLVKRPGGELEHLTPDTLSTLLFDDIPYLSAAQAEHDAFVGILRDNGAEVVYLEDLMSETLALGGGLKEQFIDEFISRSGSSAMGHKELIKEYLESIEDLKKLVDTCMVGVRVAELSEGGNRLSDMVRASEDFYLAPIPNLYFTRDPFACIGKGVSLNHMYSDTRNKETIFGKYILNHHPDFAGKVKFYYNNDNHFSIEGGDILVISPELICVGVSQRTQPEAIEILARNLFADEECEVRTVLAVEIPAKRAFMHLDTVFTQVDRDAFVVHPEVIDDVTVFELTGKGEKRLKVRQLDCDLGTAMAKYMHLDSVRLLRCGAGNRIAAAREQWNDGSNTLCIRPGTIVVYDRNYVTNKLLQDAGINTIPMISAELSRGRGGPHCMTMALNRERI